jgi:hypothetical protein
VKNSLYGLFIKQGDKTMTNKKNWLGILVMLLVFGMAVLGCASTAPKINYYNLEDVSEENCALIEVSYVDRIFNKETREWRESDYPTSGFVKIDGQGNDKLWQSAPEGLFRGYARVRVTPGIHTFTITFYLDDRDEMPLDITYDCEAGKVYFFEFQAKEQVIPGFFNLDGSPFRFGYIRTTIVINETDVNRNGWIETRREVGRKIENLDFSLTDISIGKDRERLVERK